MGFWKGICSCVACVAAISVCVASAGMATPFIAASAAPYVIGGAAVGGFFLGDKIDQENNEKEKRLLENQRYKELTDMANKQFQENQNNKNLLVNLVGKLNGTIPRKPHETDEWIKEQIAVAQNNLKSGEEKYSQMLNELEGIRKELLGTSFNLMKILGLEKMKTMDKIVLGGGLILIIYLLKG